jgi:hypothetical protein
MGKERNAYKVFVGDIEGKRPLGRPRRWWKDNIKIGLRERRRWVDMMGWYGLDRSGSG